MNNDVLKQVLRFIFLVLLQVLLLRRASPSWENFNYINIYLYPIFIMLLPLRTPSVLVITLGFILGLTIDIFYGTIGIHASACTFMAFIRPFALAMVEPRGGYNVDYSPSKRQFGIGWFLTYSAILLFAFLFWLFSVEAFTFYYIGTILLRTIFSFIVSYIILIIYHLLTDTKS